jgi:hypothetical protein
MSTPRHHVNAVMQAIRDAEVNGQVSSNRVRPRIPEWVPGHSVGRVYSMLRRQGILVHDGYELSTDEKGRNAGKVVPVYRLARPLTIADLADEPPVAPRPLHEPVRAFHSDWGPCAKCHGWVIRYGPEGRPLCDDCADEIAA